MIKKLFIILNSALLSLTLLSAQAISSQKKMLAHPHAAEFFFFQHAGNGKITVSGSDNCYQLVLTNLDKKMIYFSRSPQRTSGKITIAGFINTWEHNKIKPNAILYATLKSAGVKEQDVSDVIVMKQASYNDASNTVAYHVCSLNNTSKLQTGDLYNANIFIDPFHPWPP